MNKEDAEALLAKWGEWQQGSQNHGYSTTSTIGRAIIQGGAGASQATCPVIPDMTEEVQKVEDAVNLMDGKTQKIIRGIYIYGYSQREMSGDYKISRAEIAKRHDACANFIAGKLS